MPAGWVAGGTALLGAVSNNNASKRASNSLERGQSLVGEASDAAAHRLDEGTDERYKPYMDFGAERLAAARRLFADPSSISSTSQYKFGMEQGTNAIQNSAASKGSLFGGRTLMELMKFGGDYASSQYSNVLQQEMQGAQFGFGATQAYQGIKQDIADIQVGRGQSADRAAGSQANLDFAQGQQWSNLITGMSGTMAQNKYIQKNGGWFGNG